MEKKSGSDKPKGYKEGKIPGQLRTEDRTQNHEENNQHLQGKSYQDVNENMDN